MGSRLFLSVGAQKPSSAQFFKADALQQLRLLLAVDETTLAAELLVAWSPVLYEEDYGGLTIAKCTQIVAKFKEVFPNIICLYSGASTIGISTATCENTFSALTRILTPSRRSMTHQRKSELVRLAFEKSLLAV